MPDRFKSAMSVQAVGHGPSAEALPSPGPVAPPLARDGADEYDDFLVDPVVGPVVDPVDVPIPISWQGPSIYSTEDAPLEAEDGGRAQLLRSITDHMDTLEQLVETGTLSEKVYLDVCNVLKIGVNASKPRDSSTESSAVTGARSTMANVQDTMDSIREVIMEERANYEAQLASATQSLDELKAKVDRISKRRDHYAKRAHILEKFMNGKNIPATEISEAYSSAGILQAVQESDERRKRRKVSTSDVGDAEAEGGTRTPAGSPEASPRPARTSPIASVYHPAVVELSDDE